jgi:hypothetical protein
VLFQGYDTFANAGRSTAVSGTSASADTANQCGYTVCETFEKVLKTLNVSCSVSANEFFLDSADFGSRWAVTPVGGVSRDWSCATTGFSRRKSALADRASRQIILASLARSASRWMFACLRKANIR